MASTAVITPQPDGSAVFELNGVTHLFGSYGAAQCEADARGIPVIVDRFPLLPTVVLAELDHGPATA